MVYCVHSVYNPGGMERVLLNKVKWIRENADWEVTVVTTDQGGRPPFYDFPKGVKYVDLGVNYSRDNGRWLPLKVGGYLWRRRKHRRRLTRLLVEEQADVVVSLFPSESSFLPEIQDGSKKVLELHFSRPFRLQYGRGGLMGLIDRWRSGADVKLARKFDRFVVLTNQDRELWGEMPNIEVIPNAALPVGVEARPAESKRVIAVGRLDYQKGFDRLIRSWAKAMRMGDFEGWTLDIFGQGEWRKMLEDQAKELGVADSVNLRGTTQNVAAEYEQSAVLAMTSHYEGFPMVMIEAMSAGLPVVTMDYLCGPSDVIEPDVSGIIVEQDNEEAMARALARLMEDSEARTRMGAEARKVVDRFSEEKVMARWVEMFENLSKKR